MKKNVLLCMGLSGSGKSYFINNYLPANRFYRLVSATTRPMRAGEVNGREYYFMDEEQFNRNKYATLIWANRAFWTPDTPKWLYGVQESEILNHRNANLVYDVIQPCYGAMLREWFYKHNMGREYDFKTLYFIAPENNFDIARGRANMPDDMSVRTTNTCTPLDFLRAGLDIDFLVKSSADETILSPSLRMFLNKISRGR